jgi:dCMP deaminase
MPTLDIDLTNIENKKERYDKLFIESAVLSSKMSFCKRLQVGAVLVKDNRILVNGWNGTISGLSNSCEEMTEEGLRTSEFVLHAEQNVIAFSAKKGIPTDDCTLYVTHSPCKTCAKLIAQSGIKKVVYQNEYRDSEGIEFLNKTDVEVEKYD